jgi:hypothetical protein
MMQQVILLLKSFAAIVFVMLIIVGVATVFGYLKLRRLRRMREGKAFTRGYFIESFRSSGVPERIPATVFDYYTSSGALRDFPLSPDDTYSEVLWDDPIDIEEDAYALVERLEMQFPPEYILREYGEKPLTTLRDMVHWLDWIRQRQSALS